MHIFAAVPSDTTADAVQLVGPSAVEPIPVATVENSILAKLEWFRLTDQTSERQWDDVSRLVQLHGVNLGIDSMRTMAESIGIRDLLERLLANGFPASGRG